MERLAVLQNRNVNMGRDTKGCTYLRGRTQDRFAPPRAALVTNTEGAWVGSWYIVEALGNDLGMDVYTMSSNTFTHNNLLWVEDLKFKLTRKC